MAAIIRTAREAVDSLHLPETWFLVTAGSSWMPVSMKSQAKERIRTTYSGTALAVAAARYMSYLAGWGDDSWSESVLRKFTPILWSAAKLVSVFTPVPGVKTLVGGLLTRYTIFVPSVLTTVAPRTLWIDNIYKTAEVEQIVILGAGFDFRHHRLTALRSPALFELDSAPTQAAKRALVDDHVARHGGPKAPVIYAACDFERESLAQALERAGFSKEKPTLFVWEGVTMYLDAAAVDATLEFVWSCAPGSMIASTWIEQFDDTSAFGRRAQKFCEELGEVWKFFLPKDSAAFFKTRQLTVVEKLRAADYKSPRLPPHSSHLLGEQRPLCDELILLKKN